MKAFAQAIKKISLENQITPDKILWGRIDKEICFLDTVNKDIYSLANGLIKKCQYDENNAQNIISQTFGDPNVIAKEMFKRIFPDERTVIVKQHIKLNETEFIKDLKTMLSENYPGMEQEIDNYVNNNGKNIYRLVNSKIIAKKNKLPNGGKGKSQNSSCFINMPQRSNSI